MNSCGYIDDQIAKRSTRTGRRTDFRLSLTPALLTERKVLQVVKDEADQVTGLLLRFPAGLVMPSKAQVRDSSQHTTETCVRPDMVAGSWAVHRQQSGFC